MHIYIYIFLRKIKCNCLFSVKTLKLYENSCLNGSHALGGACNACGENQDADSRLAIVTSDDVINASRPFFSYFIKR